MSQSQRLLSKFQRSQLIEFHDHTESSDYLPDYFDSHNLKDENEIEKTIVETLTREYTREGNQDLELSAKDRRLLKGIFTTNRQELGVLHCLELQATKDKRTERKVEEPKIDKPTGKDTVAAASAIDQD